MTPGRALSALRARARARVRLQAPPAREALRVRRRNETEPPRGSPVVRLAGSAGCLFGTGLKLSSWFPTSFAPGKVCSGLRSP